MQSKVWGLHGAAVICALALGGCIDGPVGQGPTGALGYAGDAAPLSPAAPALRAALTAESTAQADDPPVLAYAPTHAANVPLPPPRPVYVVAGKTLDAPAVTKVASVARAPVVAAAPTAAPPLLATLTLTGSDPAAAKAPTPKVQLASLMVEGVQGLLPAREALGSGAAMEKQTERVDTSCFPTSLRGVLADISQHFAAPIVVTSGYRSAGENRRAGGAGHSFHVQCLAADVQIAGIAPGDIARYARSLDAVGGVGRYGHTKSVHVDVGERKFSWYGLHRRHRRSA